ncbi:MAG: two-component system phosphate regulon sensor histidine kinase PhoR [Paraglaciecola sp.]|jgi:two-component system phosphate regulon sensor histidine kinase PhoR
MYYPFSWFKSVWRVTGYFILVTVCGVYFNDVKLALTFGSLLLLAKVYWNLHQLNLWLWKSKKTLPPKIGGIWEHIYDGIYALQKRNRGRRKELAKIVRRFREGSEALPDAAVVVDASAAILWCNRLARIELGLRWPDDAGRRIYNFIRHPQFIQFYHGGHYDQPIKIPSPVNPHRILEYRIMPYGDRNLMVLIRDVTQLNLIEKMRKDFVANVSHELRTPLTVINGYLEILPEVTDVEPEVVGKAFTEMRTQSARMQSLIEELLVLSRIEASKEKVNEKIVNVPHMLAAIKIEADALNKRKGHKIIMQVDPTLQVYGIETELYSAFSNLIFNAIHYTPDLGNILVEWQWVEQHAQFLVRDNGEGIEDKHLPRLTERFYRVDKARSRKTGGSGLGLSIVKHVLNHHYSQLEITSKLGQGSEFSFAFPQELSLKSPETDTSIV